MSQSTFERLVSRGMAALAVAASCVIPQVWAADPPAALLDSPVRNAKDQAQDASRKPLELLKFAQVVPGMQVLDVASGGGYTLRDAASCRCAAGRPDYAHSLVPRHREYPGRPDENEQGDV